MPKFVQCPITNKLIPVEEYRRPQNGITIIGDIEPFISPVDGSLISSRSQLRDHNRRHSVTDQRDYGSDWFKRKARERTEELQSTTTAAKKERIETIMKAMHRHGG